MTIAMWRLNLLAVLPLHLNRPARPVVHHALRDKIRAAPPGTPVGDVASRVGEDVPGVQVDFIAVLQWTAR